MLELAISRLELGSLPCKRFARQHPDRDFTKSAGPERINQPRTDTNPHESGRAIAWSIAFSPAPGGMACHWTAVTVLHPPLNERIRALLWYPC